MGDEEEVDFGSGVSPRWVEVYDVQLAGRSLTCLLTGGDYNSALDSTRVWIRT